MNHPNLVAWYKGNGNALDSSGNDNHGTWVGTPAYEAGVFGRGLSFAANGHVKLPSSVGGLEAFTFTAWVNLESYQNNAGVAGFGPDADRGLWIFTVELNSRLLVQVETDDARVLLTMLSGTAGPTGWVHITIRYDGSFVRSYVDGQFVAEVAQTGTIIATGTDNFVGRLSAAHPLLDGTIDDARIYNAALSPSDIKRVMHGFQPLGRY